MIDAELRGISVRHTVFNDYDFSETVDHCRKYLKIRQKTTEIRNSEREIKLSGKFGVRCYFSTVYMVRGKQKMRYFTDLVFKCFKICGFIWLPRYSK